MRVGVEWRGGGEGGAENVERGLERQENRGGVMNEK